MNGENDSESEKLEKRKKPKITRVKTNINIISYYIISYS